MYTQAINEHGNNPLKILLLLSFLLHRIPILILVFFYHTHPCLKTHGLFYPSDTSIPRHPAALRRTQTSKTPKTVHFLFFFAKCCQRLTQQIKKRGGGTLKKNDEEREREEGCRTKRRDAKI